MSKHPEESNKHNKKEEKDEAKDKADAADKADKNADTAAETLSKIEELTNDLKRVQADFENYKKRVERDNLKLCEYSKAEIIKRLLAVLDSFEMALKQTDNHDEFVKGVELIYSQLYTLLKDEGLRHIDAEGKKLDPLKHDVMFTVKSDEEDDTIIEELQKGYMLKEMVLRHSKVKVAKK